MTGGTRRLFARPRVGLAANVMQHCSLRFSNVVVDSPALILLRHGTKSLESGGRRWTLQGGDAIAVAAGQSFNISNRLSDAGLYEARWLVWDASLIERFDVASPVGRPLDRAMVLKQVGHEFVAAMDRASDAVAESARLDEQVARHRLTELLVWLSVAGARFAVPRVASTSARVRSVVGESTAEAWTAPRVATRLGMSEATLRRRLGAEGVQFGSLLADVRMSFAMTLLQSTDHPIAHIAAQVGYESPSRFAVRFRDRFGFAPTVVRGHRRGGA